MFPQHGMENGLLTFRPSSQEVSVSSKTQGLVRYLSGILEDWMAMDKALHSSPKFDSPGEDISSTLRETVTIY